MASERDKEILRSAERRVEGLMNIEIQEGLSLEIMDRLDTHVTAINGMSQAMDRLAKQVEGLRAAVKELSKPAAPPTLKKRKRLNIR